MEKMGRRFLLDTSYYHSCILHLLNILGFLGMLFIFFIVFQYPRIAMVNPFVILIAFLLIVYFICSIFLRILERRMSVSISYDGIYGPTYYGLRLKVKWKEIDHAKLVAMMGIEYVKLGIKNSGKDMLIQYTIATHDDFYKLINLFASNDNPLTQLIEAERSFSSSRKEA